MKSLLNFHYRLVYFFDGSCLGYISCYSTLFVMSLNIKRMVYANHYITVFWKSFINWKRSITWTCLGSEPQRKSIRKSKDNPWICYKFNGFSPQIKISICRVGMTLKRHLPFCRLSQTGKLLELSKSHLLRGLMVNTPPYSYGTKKGKKVTMCFKYSPL